MPEEDRNLIIRAAKWLVGAVAILVLLAVALAAGTASAGRGMSEPAGVISVVCTNENDIKRAVAHAERGNVEGLKKVAETSSCQAAAAPQPAAFFDQPAVTIHLRTRNAGDGIVWMGEEKHEDSSAWFLALMNPGYAHSRI